MRYLAVGLLVSTLALGQASSSAPPAAQSIPVDQENATKAKALIDQTIQALGGNAYLNIQDVTQDGRTYSFHHGEPTSAGVLFWRFYRFPDKERTEFTKQRDVAYVYRGDEGFEITFKGVRADDPKSVADVIRRRDYSLDWVLRKWLHEPGIALFYEGTTVAEQKNVQQVTVLNSKNQGVTLYIDTETHLPVKTSYTWRDPTDKERNIESQVYDAYRMVQGVMTPFSLTRFYNGDMSNQRFLNTVSYNTGLKDSLFDVSPTYDVNKPPPRK
jgi:hypothetical protein